MFELTLTICSVAGVIAGAAVMFAASQRAQLMELRRRVCMMKQALAKVGVMINMDDFGGMVVRGEVDEDSNDAGGA